MSNGGVIARAYRSIRKDGLSCSCEKLLANTTDRLFDFRFGVETSTKSDLDPLTIEGNNKAGGYRYDPTRVRALRRMFREMRPLFTPESVLVDIGSGKGRVLMIASEFGFRRVRGVEFARELCDVARANVRQYKARTGSSTEFEIIQGDATERQVPEDEDVFMLCNPFDGAILEKVLDRVLRSLRDKPRRALLIYYNPRWSDVLARRTDLRWLRDIHLPFSRFAVYSNFDR